MPNMFKKGDLVKGHDCKSYTVTYTNGPYVYGNGCRHYSDVTFISNPEIISLIQDGKKIEAIKAYRIVTGLGLKEAKDAVEALDMPKTKFGPGDVVTKLGYGESVVQGYADDNRVRVKYDNYLGICSAPEETYTLVRRANPDPTLGDILSDALKPKGKFKVGDKITNTYDKNTVYTVNDVRSDGWFRVMEYLATGYYSGEYFILAPTPTIVIRFDVGKGYRPNDKPVVHNSLAEATKEAERLALANPGVKFDTFTLATSSTATAPVAGTVTTVSA